MPSSNSASAAGESVVHSGCSRARNAAQAAMPAAAATRTIVEAMTSCRLPIESLLAAHRQQRHGVVRVFAAGEGGELGEDRFERGVGIGGGGGERLGPALGGAEVAR